MWKKILHFAGVMSALRGLCALLAIPWVITSLETSTPWWKSHVFQIQHSVKHVVTTSLPAQEGSHVLPTQAGRPQGWGHATKKTTGFLSNESFWSSAGLKSNGAKRVVQSGELSWVEEHVVQYKCSCMRKQGEEMSPVFAKELELPVKKHCSRGRESNSFLPRYRRISACYLEQLKTNKNTPPHLKKTPNQLPQTKNPTTIQL